MFSMDYKLELIECDATIDVVLLKCGGDYAAIDKHLPLVVSEFVPGAPLNKIITVNGRQIQYTAFQLSKGVVNVGRIHGVP